MCGIINLVACCSSDEHRLNCGLDFLAEVCETFLHYISRGLIFKWYGNSDGGCHDCMRVVSIFHPTT